MSIFDTERIEKPEKVETCDMLKHGFRLGRRGDIIKTGLYGSVVAIFYPKNAKFEGKKLRRSLLVYSLGGKKNSIRDVNKYDFETIMASIEVEQKR